MSWWSYWCLTITILFTGENINYNYRGIKIINLTGGAFTFLFPGARTVKLIKNAVNVTNSQNPLTLTTNITPTIVDCCTPPPVRLVAHCTTGVVLIVAANVSPNPLTISSAVYLITEIYNEC